MKALADLPEAKQHAVQDCIEMFKTVTGRDDLDDNRLVPRVIEMFQQMADAQKLDGSTEHDQHGLFIATSVSGCAAIVNDIETGEFDVVLN